MKTRPPSSFPFSLGWRRETPFFSYHFLFLNTIIPLFNLHRDLNSPHFFYFAVIGYSIKLAYNILPDINIAVTSNYVDRMAAQWNVQKENPDGIMVVSPADHLIENNKLFKEGLGYF